MGTPKEYDETIDRLDRSVGLRNLRVWHLNDSCRECGSRIDRHAAIGAGHMGLEPFRHLVNDSRFRDLPMILETPKGIEDGEDLDARNLKVLRQLVRRPRSSRNALRRSSLRRTLRRQNRGRRIEHSQGKGSHQTRLLRSIDGGTARRST